MVKTILEIDGMTEKEKMLKGELYNADYDPELIAERTQAKDLCFELNNTTPSDLETRIDIIKKLLGKTGEENFCGNENNSLYLIKNNLSPEEEGLFQEIMSR